MKTEPNQAMQIRVCHGSCSEQNVPRQLLSSLILYVRQIKLTLGIILVAAAILMLVGCKEQNPSIRDDGSCNDDQIELAVIKGDANKVRKCLEQGFPVSGTSSHVNAPAYWAIAENKPEIFNILIRHGLDVNFDWGFNGGNLLTNATQFGHVAIVRILLENDASTERDPINGRSPLYASMIYDKQEIKALLIEHGAQLNSWDRDALIQLGIREGFEEAEQVGAGPPATRSESKSEDSDQP